MPNADPNSYRPGAYLQRVERYFSVENGVDVDDPVMTKGGVYQIESIDRIGGTVRFVECPGNSFNIAAFVPADRSR